MREDNKINIMLFINVVAILIISFCALLLLLWGFPELIMRLRGYSISPELGITAAISITGGLGAVVLLVINYRKQSLSEKEANYQKKKDLIQAFNDYAKDLTQQTPQAVAALHGLAHTTDQLVTLGDDMKAYKQRCVNIICSFIRSQISEIETKLAEIKQGEAFRIITDHLEKTDSNESNGKEGTSNDENAEEDITSWSGCNFNFSEVTLFAPLRIERCVFKGRVEFWGATFKRSVYANGVHFKDVNFNGVTFEGKRSSFVGATFGKISFQGNCTFNHKVDFSGATFEENVCFHGYEDDQSNIISYPGKTTFKGATIFKGATFKKGARFEKVIFEKEVIFKGVTFEKEDNKATIEKEVSFKEATFKGLADFTGAKFNMVDFSETSFEEKVRFNGIECASGFDLGGATAEKV